MSTTFTLGDILAPMSADAFRSGHLFQKPLHVKGDAAKWGSAMDWQQLEDLVNMSGIWSGKSLELVHQQKRLPPEAFCVKGLDRDTRENWIVDLGRVQQWLREGATLTLNDISTLTPGLRAIARALEGEVGGKVQANLYCSWQEHPGFTTHFDTHEVFVAHIAGKKRWRVYQRPIENPIMHPMFKSLPREFHEKNHGPVSMEIVLEPGDFLYLPRGWYHDALALTEGTIHVTFGLTPAIGLDALSRLFEAAVGDATFRAALAAAPEARAKQLAELGQRTAALMASPDFAKRVDEFVKAYAYRPAELTLPVAKGKAA